MPKRKSPNASNPKSAGEARRRRLTLSKIESDDILTEILVLLPTKSLIRFKSVSKKWHSLISSDYFCRCHHLRHPKPQPSLILEKQNHLSYFNPAIKNQNMEMLPPFTLSVPHHQILQSCNGLMLLKSKDLENSYHVYNPATRRSREITLPLSLAYRNVAGLHLAFDPLKSPHYKIVCVKTTSAFEDRYMEEQPYKIDVYDSESRSWRRAMKAFLYSASFFSTDGMHWDGKHWNNAIHWTSGDGYHYFDIAKNEIKVVPLPEIPFSEIRLHHLEELNGCLYHVAALCDWNGSKPVALWVWELGGDDRGPPKWRIKHHDPVAGCIGILKVMGGGSDDDEGICSLLFQAEEKIRSYSFLDKTYEDVCDITDSLFNVFDFGEVMALV